VPDRFPFRRGLLRGALLVCGLLGLVCTPPPDPPLQVEYTGCTKVFLPGPVCVPREHRQLALWVKLPPEVQLEIRAGGRRLKSTAVAVQGGQRLVIELPPDASPVEVRAAMPHRAAAWSLEISPQRESPGAATSRQGRLALVERGDLDTAQTLLARAIVAHRTAGALLAEVDDAGLLVWIQIQRRQFAAARQILSSLELPAGSPADAAYYRSYYRGMLAESTGDARSALADLEAAIRQVERVNGIEVLRWDAEQLLGRQLQALGRSREAARLFDRLRRSPPPTLKPCDWSEMLSNQAWSLLLAAEAGERLGDPLPLLAEARRVAERAACQRPDERRLNILLNLALAHLQAGRLAPARATLSEARALGRFAQPLQTLWGLELAARLDLAEGRPADALRLYDRLEELAASVLAPDGRWRAAYGRARCYQALGRSEEALAALGEAEELLDAQSLEIPIQEGRETFAAQREGATKLYLELLLASGRDADALEVARHSRSRVLRQLARGDRLAHLSGPEQRRWDDALAEYWNRRAALDAGAADEWRLPADQRHRRREARAAQYEEAARALDRAFAVLGGPAEHATLSAPRPGEVVLAYHPLPRGWVGFAAEGRTVAVHRFELPENALAQPEELAARLLSPFQARIGRARRLRILPYGILRTVDFHALPFRGDVLLAALPVAYGLDLGAPAQSRPATERRALVVANPSEDLPAALLEADAVAAALRRGQPAWSTRVLRGTEASAGEVRRSLAGADLLHYAGHGVFSGSGGWDSVLPLAGGTRLTLSDLLAFQRVPRWVVLSGCDTGKSGADAPAEGLGLAHAFLLAGSREVIAATRPVGDRAAQGLLTELYRRWSPAPDLAALLRDAQLAWRRRDPTGDWQSFRLFEP
jgi:hypothetical protein